MRNLLSMIATVAIIHLSLSAAAAQELKAVTTLKHNGLIDDVETPVGCLAFSPNGKVLASGSGNTLKLWDVESWTEKANFKHDFPGHGYVFVDSVAFSPDEKTVATSRVGYFVRLWDIANAKPNVLPKFPKQVGRVAFSSDGDLWIFGGVSEVITRWDTAAGKTKAEFVPLPILRMRNVGFTPDGKSLVVRLDRTMALLDSAKGTRQSQWTIDSPNALPTDFAVGPAGKLVAVGYTDGGVKLFDLTSDKHEPKKAWNADKDHATPHAFSPADKLLATTSGNNVLKLWTTDDGKEISVPNRGAIRCVAFSPDGTYMVGGDANKSFVHVWKIR